MPREEHLAQGTSHAGHDRPEVQARPSKKSNRLRVAPLHRVYTIELAGYKKEQVTEFVQTVRWLLISLHDSDITGHKQVMYDWLFEKFKA